MKSINVGLVGYGMAGEFFHAPLIAVTKGLVLHTVVERHKEKSKEKYSDVSVIRGIDELLSNEFIDLVVIASPNNTHFDFAKRALLAGKHVVVDKPFTVTFQEAKDLVALAEKQEKLITVYQNRRLDGDFLTVQKLIKEGTLGEIQEYRAHYDRFRPTVNHLSWKEAAGVFYDLGPHLIDQALVLFGKPHKITTHLEKQRVGTMVEDYFEVHFQFPTVKAMVSASMLMENPRPRFQVIGSKGTFTKYGLDPQENLLKAGAIPKGDNWGSDPEENWGVLETSKGLQKIKTEKGNYPSYYANVYQAILGEEELFVDPQLPTEVIRIIEEGRKS